MHFFFGDETCKTPNDGEFFVYGGLVLSDDQVVELHRLVRSIRADWSLGPEEQIKFTLHAKPKRLADDDWREIKAQLLEGLLGLEATFMAYFIHHEIIKNKDVQTRNRLAIEPILYRYQKFLREVDDHGMAVLDNIEEEELRRLDIARINAEGISYEEEVEPVPLDRIVGIARAHIEWTHCLSANDVLLGAFGYSINRPEYDVTEDMMKLISRLFWYREEGGVRYLGDRGLIQRPLEIKVPAIRKRYEYVEEQLTRLLNL